jgi:hypothetical protein
LIHALGLLKRAHPIVASVQDREPVFLTLKSPARSENLFDLKARIPLGWYVADNQDRENLTEIWCTPVLSSVSDIEGRRDWHCLAMVELSANGVSRVFMRVGMAWIKESHWFGDITEEHFSIL